jgi:HSP20 family protein
MASFFEKLKKGMGIEISEEEIEEEKLEKKPKKEISKRIQVSDEAEESDLSETKTKQVKPSPQKKKIQKLKVETKSVEPKIKEIEKTEEIEEKEEKVETKKEKWFEPEGQLAVDVYQTESEIVIQSTIAGVKPEDLDISIENDTILIKGNREQPLESGEKNYFYQECYWGPFSRQIILPEETDPNRAEATMKEGILTIRIPKIKRKERKKILVKG